MPFNSENIYIIVEDYFNQPDRYILLEEHADKTNEVIKNLDLTRFEGKGACVFLCRLLGPVDWSREDEDYEFVMTEDGVNYSFEVIDCLDMFPRIEGEFTPGIYPDQEIGTFYELKTVNDLSELFSRYIENGVGFDEFKVVCKEKELKVILLENKTKTTLETIPTYPFSYFDVYCPICSQKIVTYELMTSDTIRCAIKRVKCRHYYGRVEKENGKYLKASLNYLKIAYQLQDDELFLLTAKGWQKPIAFTPPQEPENSHWGASGGKGFTDVFLFLETISIVKK